MAEGKLQPADSSEEVPLPATKAPDFDLSDESISGEHTDGSDDSQPEAGAQGEPEGIFSLFDREFPPGERNPLEPAESTEFDREFSESFETMFTAVKGDGSAPLFETGESAPSAEESEPENAEGSMPPLPKLAPEPEDSKPAPRSERSEVPSLPREVPPAAPTEPEGSEEMLQLDEPDDIFPDSFSTPDESSDLETLDADPFAEDELEELNFDDSDDDELFDGVSEGSGDDSADEFDDFAKMALGFEDSEDSDEDDGPVDEEDDFIVEELEGAKELDPFESVAIMSSEDVAKYDPGFGENELKFQDEEPLPEDEDPFAMPGNGGPIARADEELPQDLDPFGPEAAALADSANKSKSPDDPADSESKEVDSEATSRDDDGGDSSENSDKGNSKERGRGSSGVGIPKIGGAILGLLSIPWRLFSTLTGILFGLLESVISLLGKIPLIGLPFRLLSSVLSAVPMALKRIIVLLLIVVFFWGGSALVGGLLPKPSADVSLPDLGSASFSSVELKDGQITGEIENAGEVNLLLFPEVQVSERKLLQPGSWFSPVALGTCRGPLTEVAVDTTVKVSFGCDVATDSSSSLKPALKE